MKFCGPYVKGKKSTCSSNMKTTYYDPEENHICCKTCLLNLKCVASCNITEDECTSMTEVDHD